MRTHGRTLRVVQWCVVAPYLVLVAVPAFLPLPPEDAHWYDNLVLTAQWLFWGLWWPLVIASMFVLGRTWCGVFCPEGTLSEAASRHGLGRGVPRWLRWGGWPFVAFALTTIFGQLVSVYQYATATLLVLGGSTLAAIAVGFVYGKGKRVWCRHLCPVNGVFAILARMSPRHFRVDTRVWLANTGRTRAHPVNCAPMVRIRRMSGASECHMCARCSGLHGAVALAARVPGREIARIDLAEARAWDAALIVFGMIGLAVGAFEWSATPWFVELRTALASHVLEHGPAWLLADNAPWWLLTHYPDAHDVFTWLDGALIVGWIVGTALVLGGFITLCLALASLPAGGGNSAPRLCPELRADAPRRHRAFRRALGADRRARERRGRAIPCVADAAMRVARQRGGLERVDRLSAAENPGYGIAPRACACGVFTLRGGRSRRLVSVRLPRWLNG